MWLKGAMPLGHVSHPRPPDGAEGRVMAPGMAR
jgi:hypothetical protein